ncbi:MAG: creatininase family protein [Candidatus Moranbacteria bacterium]|nr:creatininase family protein [Candidatus Moranbacteria bacterium]
MKRLNEMTWEEFNQLDRIATLFVLPLGSTEQHGERLPLGTDHFFAEKMAEEIALAIPGSILMPTMNYGMSWHHTAFPGTMSISDSTYKLIIFDILCSITRHGFKKIFIANGHGGNHHSITDAITRVKALRNCEIANPLVDIATSNEFKQLIQAAFNENGVHAGAMEVSIMEYLFPNKPTLIKGAGCVTSIPNDAVWGQGTDSPEKWRELFPMGQKGNQKNSDPQKGKEIFDYITNKMVQIAKKMMEENS